MKLTTNLTVENLLKNEKWTSQFDVAQLNMIRSGIQQGYDVSIYADPKFSWCQMGEIFNWATKKASMCLFLQTLTMKIDKW